MVGPPKWAAARVAGLTSLKWPARARRAYTEEDPCLAHQQKEEQPVSRLFFVRRIVRLRRRV